MRGLITRSPRPQKSLFDNENLLSQLLNTSGTGFQFDYKRRCLNFMITGLQIHVTEDAVKLQIIRIKNISPKLYVTERKTRTRKIHTLQYISLNVNEKFKAPNKSSQQVVLIQSYVKPKYSVKTRLKHGICLSKVPQCRNETQLKT